MSTAEPQMELTSGREPGSGSKLCWRARFLLFLFVAVVYGASPVVQNTDSYLSLPTAHSMLYERDTDLDEFQQPYVQGHYGLAVLSSGRSVNAFPWAEAILFIPIVAALDLGHAAGLWPSSRSLIDQNRTDAIQYLTASLVTAIVAVLVALIAFERIPRETAHRQRIALGVAIVFAFGSAAWSTASRALWQHGPSMLCLALALLLAQRLVLQHAPRTSRSARLAIGLGAALAAACAVRPTNIVSALLFGGWVLFRRREDAVFFTLGAAAVLLPWILVNVTQLGTWLPRYSSPGAIGWHADYGEALAANLVSPARGLIVYSPAVLLAIPGVTLTRRKLRSLDWVLLISVTSHLLVVSAFRGTWWAGHSYGPRFMSDTLVFVSALATPTVVWIIRNWNLRRPRAQIFGTVAGLLVVLSILVNSQGAVARATVCWNGEPNIDQNPERVWLWNDPQFLAGVTKFRDSGSLRAAILEPCTESTDEPVDRQRSQAS